MKSRYQHFHFTKQLCGDIQVYVTRFVTIEYITSNFVWEPYSLKWATHHDIRVGDGSGAKGMCQSTLGVITCKLAWIITGQPPAAVGRWQASTRPLQHNKLNARMCRFTESIIWLLCQIEGTPRWAHCKSTPFVHTTGTCIQDACMCSNTECEKRLEWALLLLRHKSQPSQLSLHLNVAK